MVLLVVLTIVAGVRVFLERKRIPIHTLRSAHVLTAADWLQRLAQIRRRFQTRRSRLIAASACLLVLPAAVACSGGNGGSGSGKAAKGARGRDAGGAALTSPAIDDEDDAPGTGDDADRSPGVGRPPVRDEPIPEDEFRAWMSAALDARWRDGNRERRSPESSSGTATATSGPSRSTRRSSTRCSPVSLDSSMTLCASVGPLRRAARRPPGTRTRRR